MTVDTLVKSEDNATITGTGPSPDSEGLSTTTTSMGLCLHLMLKYLTMFGQRS